MMASVAVEEVEMRIADIVVVAAAVGNNDLAAAAVEPNCS